MKTRVLIVDDDQALRELLRLDLRRRGLEIETASEGEQALQLFRERTFDVVLTDMNMPRLSGIDLCRALYGCRPDVPVVVITAFGSMETAIAALRAGAYDFVTKPIELDLLHLVIQRAAQHRSLRQQIDLLREGLDTRSTFHELVGESAAMLALFDQIARVADTDTSVLIQGESGTGKELVARALHHRSRRRDNPFVAINCAALPETLLESELFGHTKGAFTDARAARTGLFMQADGGTLLLDEIGDFPLTLQPKLLRALEDRKVRPLGDEQERPFDVRILASTHRDLDSALDAGRFRQDLYYRINVLVIQVPPLRSRGTDILLLAQHFIQEFAQRGEKKVTGLSESAGHKLLEYDWPGNVRELRNAIERAVVLTRFDKLVQDDLPERIRDHRRTDLSLGGGDPAMLIPMEEVERRYILHVLSAVRGNKAQAARILGFDRKTMYRKLDHFGVDPERLSAE